MNLSWWGRLALALLPVSAPSAVVISEIMARNDTILTDEDGHYSDWIELYNHGSAPVNLGGWHLTDNAANPTNWTFPAVTLDPHGILLVFAHGGR